MPPNSLPFSEMMTEIGEIGVERISCVRIEDYCVQATTLSLCKLRQFYYKQTHFFC